MRRVCYSKNSLKGRMASGMRKRQNAAWLLAALALLFVLAGMFFPAASCCHTCLGSHCPVCLQMRMWGTVLRVFGAILFTALYAASAAHSLRLRAADAFAPVRSTPVALKIKLLN